MLYNTANVKIQDPAQIEWHAINWQAAQSRVTQIRHRIFRASKEGYMKKVRNLQKLMMKSVSNRLLAIRKVTQVNKGKNTPGIDNIIISNNSQRNELYKELIQYTPKQVKAVKRIYIPKPKGDGERPLGLPTIIDRCQQAIVKTTLEPYWEAKFEESSYGFRIGRSAKDAIQRVRSIARYNTTRPWILKIDIKGAFDNINHEYLYKKIGNIPNKVWIRQWLKAGIIHNGRYQITSKGTPQGGVISPLLLNVALHGLENMLELTYEKSGALKTKSPYAVVRYADDLVIFGKTRESLEEAKAKVRAWLKKKGLELAEHKTYIKHIEEGFNYLGFQIRRHYNNRGNSGRKAVLIVKPSKESVKELKKDLRTTWKKVISLPTRVAMKWLNQKLIGWGQYYKNCNAAQTFSSIDQWMWIRRERYLHRRHPNASWKWKWKNYIGDIPKLRRRNVFMDKKTGAYLWKLTWIPIRWYIPVKRDYSPDNPKLKQYWKKRQKKTNHYPFGPEKRLWIRQGGRCSICKMPIDNQEITHIHHIIPKKEGGSNKIDNLCILHKMCHQQIHSKHGKDIKLQRTA